MHEHALGAYTKFIAGQDKLLSIGNPPPLHSFSGASRDQSQSGKGVHYHLNVVHKFVYMMMSALQFGSGMQEPCCPVSIFPPLQLLTEGIYKRSSQLMTAMALSRFVRRPACVPSGMLLWMLMFQVPKNSGPWSGTETRAARSKRSSATFPCVLI